MTKTQKNGGGAEVPKLTIEDIDMQECFRHLSEEEKLALISFVYEISLALYNSYRSTDE